MALYVINDNYACSEWEFSLYLWLIVSPLVKYYVKLFLYVVHIDVLAILIEYLRTSIYSLMIPWQHALKHYFVFFFLFFGLYSELYNFK